MRIQLIAAAAAVMFATSASAADVPLQISYPTDGTLTCDQIAAEVARMDLITGLSAQEAAGAQGSARAAELGTSAVINGALYSGALGRVPGLGMFANAAGEAAKRRAAEKQAASAQLISTAQTRRAVMSGIYQGKNCGAAQVAAPAAPAAATAAAVTPVANPQ